LATVSLITANAALAIASSASTTAAFLRGRKSARLLAELRLSFLLQYLLPN